MDSLSAFWVKCSSTQYNKIVFKEKKKTCFLELKNYIHSAGPAVESLAG